MVPHVKTYKMETTDAFVHLHSTEKAAKICSISVQVTHASMELLAILVRQDIVVIVESAIRVLGKQ